MYTDDKKNKDHDYIPAKECKNITAAAAAFNDENKDVNNNYNSRQCVKNNGKFSELTQGDKYS